MMPWTTQEKISRMEAARLGATLQRTEGKEYVVNDGDVIEFLFNV